MSAAQPPPLLQQQQLQQQQPIQQIQQMQQLQQPLLPHDPGAGGDEERALLPPHASQQPLPAAVLQAGPHSGTSQHVQLQQQQPSLFARPAEFLPQQQFLYPHMQQQALLQPMQGGMPPVGTAGGGVGRSTTGSSNCSVPPQRAVAAGAPANPSGTSGCNQIQVEPRHVLQLLRQLVEENPESFKRFQVRPDMPPRAVHQLLRELEEARLIKQQEVLRRAHALALQQQQQREGGSESLSPSSSACATPPPGGVTAEQRHQQQEGGRRSRGQQQQQQGHLLAGEAAESEKRKKRKKKAVFPEGPGGWGPEAKSSSNAAAAAAAATGAAAPSAAALSHTCKSTHKSPADGSRALKILPTLSHDKQGELLAELLAAPEGLVRVQELKDAGRLPSASVQQALRKLRQQQHQQQQSLMSSSSAGAHGREGADHNKDAPDAEESLVGVPGASEETARQGGKSGGRNGAGSSICAPAVRASGPGSLIAEQKRPPFVKALHAWTCREDAWAAAATAAAAGVGCLPGAAARTCVAVGADEATAAAAAAASVADPAGGDFGWRNLASAGDHQKVYISSPWLDEAAAAGRTETDSLLPLACYLERTGGVLTTPSYSDQSAADVLFPFPEGTPAACAGNVFRQRNGGGWYVSGGGSREATEGRRDTATAPTAHNSVLQKGLHDAGVGKGKWTVPATHEWGLWHQQIKRFQPQPQFLLSDVQRRMLQGNADSRALLCGSNGCNELPGTALAAQWMTHRRAAAGGGLGGAPVALDTAVGGTDLCIADQQLQANTALAARISSSAEREFGSVPPFISDSTNAWKAAVAARQGASGATERGRARVDPAALLFFGRGVPPGTDDPPVPGAAARRKASTPSRHLSKLDTYIQRLVELTMRRLGAAYGGRLFVTDEAEIRAILKQALKDRLRDAHVGLFSTGAHVNGSEELCLLQTADMPSDDQYLRGPCGEATSSLNSRRRTSYFAAGAAAGDDCYRAMAPTLCALAEYRAERHLQRLVAAAEAQQRPSGEGKSFEEGENGERATLLVGSSVGSRGGRTSLQQEFYAAPALRDYAAGSLLEEIEHQQQFPVSRKRSHGDVWQSHAAAEDDGTDAAFAAAEDSRRAHAARGGEGREALPREREKSSGKSLLQRLAVYQRFDELHALFMQKESDKLLVEHLRKLQEHLRKGKASRAKNKGILATDSSVQSAPFIRNSDDTREAHDGMGAYQSANGLSLRGSASEAGAAAAFAYLERQAQLLNGSSINSEADAQLALLSAQLQLELRQRHLAEIAEEQVIEFAKVAHSQRLLLLKATALDFRTFLHTRTAAAVFPMRFRERLLQYVEAVHFDLQSPPARIPRSLLPVASPPQSAAEGAAGGVAARTAAAASKGAAGPPGRATTEKPCTTGSSSTFAARSGGSSAALSRAGASAKSSTTLSGALAADGLPQPPDTAVPTVLESAKSLETSTGAVAKEGRATASGMSLFSPNTTHAQGTASQLPTEAGSGLAQVSGSPAGYAGGATAGSVAADRGSSVTGKKSGVLKVPKTRVRKKASSSLAGAGKATTRLPPVEAVEEAAGVKIVESGETPPGVRKGSGARGKSGIREVGSGAGPPGSGRSVQQSSNSLPSAAGAGGARRNYVSEAKVHSVHVASSDSVMADNRQLLQRQQEARTTPFPSRSESLAQLFGIPTVEVSGVANATPQRAESTGLQLKPDGSNSGSSRSGAGHLPNKTSSAGRRAEVLQTQQTQADMGYAAVDTTQWGGGVLAGDAAAADALSCQQPQQTLHHQQFTEHGQKSGYVMQQDDGFLVTGNAYTNEQLGGFTCAGEELAPAFGIVPAAGCSSADVVIPELEGEGEEDCL